MSAKDLCKRIKDEKERLNQICKCRKDLEDSLIVMQNMENDIKQSLQQLETQYSHLFISIDDENTEVDSASGQKVCEIDQELETRMEMRMEMRMETKAQRRMETKAETRTEIVHPEDSRKRMKSFIWIADRDKENNYKEVSMCVNAQTKVHPKENRTSASNGERQECKGKRKRDQDDSLKRKQSKTNLIRVCRECKQLELLRLRSDVTCQSCRKAMEENTPPNFWSYES